MLQDAASISPDRKTLSHSVPHNHLEEHFYEEVEAARARIFDRVWPGGATPRDAFDEVTAT